MSDYIKRDDLLNALNAQRIEYNAAVNETIIKLPSADVVEADKAQKEIDYWHDKAQSYEQTILKLALNKADVVEVVRCKDCKHKPNGYTDDDVLRYPNFPHEENNPCPCQVYEDEWYSWIPNDDFYCGYGEKM